MAKVGNFLKHKHDSLYVHEYELKFTKQAHYALYMSKDIKSRISLFVAGLGHLSIRLSGINAY